MRQMDEFISSSELSAKLTLLADVAQKLWAKNTIYHRYFTIHGTQHSKNLLDNYATLVPDWLKEDLHETDALSRCGLDA